MTAYLAKYGARVIANGYEILPIKPGTKRPPFKEWEGIRSNPRKLEKWLDQGRGSHGVGILARKTPMVDIDCHDPAIVKAMVRFTVKLLGQTVQRVGLPPKTGLLYRTDKPFPKVNSRVFVDPDDNADKPVTHKLEVLGDGQQFVAFAIHPDTEKPYRWADQEAPHNVAWADLPEITRDDALEIAARFETLMEEAGFIAKQARRQTLPAIIEDDEDLEFAGVSPKVDLNTADLNVRLKLVPGADDYDTWREVGMALYHQYDGAEEGLLLWHEWSSQAHNYDQDVLDAKWPSFDIEGKSRQPTTAKFILKLANEEERRIAGEQLDETKAEIKACKDERRLVEACEKVKHIPFEPIVRDSIVNLVRKVYKDITGDAMPLARARQLTRFENPEAKRKPKWLQGFVYVEKDKVFYHTENRIELDREAFNAKHNRFMLTQKDKMEGRSEPENTATSMALNVWEIETVYRRMYMPHEDEFFTYNGQRFVNFYTEIGVPDLPEKIDARQKEMVRRCQRHLKHLFEFEHDWKLLLDWLAYIVQEKKRVSWAPVIQGAEGDGKSFWYRLLARVLGVENVALVTGNQLEENYNGWLEGALVVFVEEVRLHGAKRYEAINRMKTWVTNDMVTVRQMHRGAYSIVNTASLLLTTNHKDGVPAGGNDSRYFPMFSRWQTKRALDRFNGANPVYYDELHEALEYPEAILHWLMNHEISPSFRPDARAPTSTYRAEMVHLNESDEETTFDELLAASTRRDFSDTMLDSRVVGEMLEDAGVTAPYGRALKRFLSERGFAPFRRVKIGSEALNLWSRTPHLFRTPSGEQDNEAIRAWIEKGDVRDDL